jgi:hypothetical protein
MFKDFYTGNIKVAHLPKHIMNTHVYVRVYKVPHIILGMMELHFQMHVLAPLLQGKNP